MTSEQKLRILEGITKYSLDMICTIELDGTFSYVSDACRHVLGYESEEMIGRPFSDFIIPEEHSITNQAAAVLIENGKLNNFENTYLHKNGHHVHLLWSGSWSEDDEAYICIARDVTEERIARLKLKEKDELHRALVEYGHDMLTLLDTEGVIIYTNGAVLKQFGYTPESLVNKSTFNYLHPDDIEKAKTALTKLATEKYVHIPELRFRTEDGKWRWIEANLSNQLQNEYVKALVCSSRDITEHVENRHRLQESEQQYKSLFDNHADAVLYQDKKGLIIDANPVALALMGSLKQDVLNKPFSQFIPTAAVPTCDATLKHALYGKPLRYEIDMTFPGKSTAIFEVMKIPVIVYGEIIGVYSILKDITALYNSRAIIEKQAQKLNNILESITDAFFTLDKDWYFSYVNSVFAKYMGHQQESLIGKNIWALFPRLNNTVFYNKCKEAAESGNVRHFEESFTYSGKTYQFSVYPSDEGLSVYFTDITELVRSKEELEKLSLVASRTTNGVLIISRDHRIEWVNKGFTKMTGFSMEEAVGRVPSELLYHEQANEAVLTSAKEQMDKGEAIAFEVLNRKKDGEDLWLSVEINPIYDEQGSLLRFIVIQTDITALKKSELSLSELTQDLYRQNRDLQQFTYIVSHNLRAPVANVLGLAKMLSLADKNSPVYDKAVKNLQESAIQLDQVVRDVNTILSVRDGRHTIEKEQVKLAEVCRQACMNLQDSVKQCGGNIEIDIEEELYVNGNKAYLHSIFYNLLSNSIKYRSDERTLHVEVKAHKIPGNGTVITFSDNGSGFDIERAGSNLFKLYQRFHTDRKGRGIGLYLVKTHVEAMEGRIEVSSEINKGTKFSIYLN